MNHLLIVVGLVACGGSGSGGETDDERGVDGGEAGDAGDDASPDAAISTTACDYEEAAEGMNNVTTMGEDIGVLEGRHVICGALHPGTGDIDGYSFTRSGEPQEYVFRLFVSDGAQLDFGSVFLTNEAGSPVDEGKLAVDHVAFVGTMSLSSYTVGVYSSYTGATLDTVPYVLVIEPIDAAGLCPTIADAPSYTEAQDGPDSTGNDVIFRDTTHFAYTDSPDDAPEPTNLELDAIPVRIAAVSADVPKTDAFFDRDTFEIVAGSAINEVAVRIHTPGARTPVPMAFVPNELIDDKAYPLETTGVEAIMLMATRPNTAYWLYAPMAGVGNADLPVSYDISLCGARTTPPDPW